MNHGTLTPCSATKFSFLLFISITFCLNLLKLKNCAYSAATQEANARLLELSSNDLKRYATLKTSPTPTEIVELSHTCADASYSQFLLKSYPHEPPLFSLTISCSIEYFEKVFISFLLVSH